MELWNQLRNTIENMYKLMRYKENHQNPILDELLEDLCEKEARLLEQIEKDRLTYKKIIHKLETEYHFSMSKFSFNNLLIHMDQPLTVLRIFLDIKRIYDYFELQDFSNLTHKQVESFIGNPYFDQYQKLIQLKTEMESKIWKQYMKLSGHDLFESNFLFYSKEKQAVDTKKENPELEEKIAEILIEDVSDLYQDLLTTDNKLLYQEQLSLWESCLLNISSIHFHRVSNRLQTTFQKIPREYRVELAFHEMNTFLRNNGFATIEEKTKEENEDNFFMELYGKPNYSYTCMRRYEDTFFRLKKKEREIFAIYQKLIQSKINGETKEKRKIFQELISKQLEEEKKIFESITDYEEFNSYISRTYQKNQSFVYPCFMASLLSNGNPLEDLDKKESLILERIIDYPQEKKLEIEDEEDEDYIFSDTLTALLEESPDIICSNIERLLYTIIKFQLKQMKTKEFLEELESAGYDFEEFQAMEQEVYIYSIWNFIGNRFLNLLAENGYQDLVYTSLFTEKQTMQYLLEHDFEIEKLPPIVIKESSYEEIKKEILDEVTNVLKDFDSSHKVQADFSKWYIQSCCLCLKPEDKELLRKDYEKILKRNRTKNKKNVI